MIYHQFYKSLLKSDLTLSDRAAYKKLITQHIRRACPDEWASIASDTTHFSKPLDQLRRDGYLTFSHPLAFSIASDLSSYDCRGGYKESKLSPVSDTLPNVKDNHNVIQLCKDASIYKFVSLYLGAPAKISKVLAWWQYPSSSGDVKCNNQQLWHRDRDDFSSLKLFIYCSDVDLDSGPHAFIPGSHDPTQLESLFESNS